MGYRELSVPRLGYIKTASASVADPFNGLSSTTHFNTNPITRFFFSSFLLSLFFFFFAASPFLFSFSSTSSLQTLCRFICFSASSANISLFLPYTVSALSQYTGLPSIFRQQRIQPIYTTFPYHIFETDQSSTAIAATVGVCSVIYRRLVILSNRDRTS